MTFVDEVGLLRVYLAGLPQSLTFQWSTLLLWQYSQVRFRAQGESKGYEKIGRVIAIILIQKSPMVGVLEYISHCKVNANRL